VPVVAHHSPFRLFGAGFSVASFLGRPRGRGGPSAGRSVLRGARPVDRHGRVVLRFHVRFPPGGARRAAAGPTQAPIRTRQGNFGPPADGATCSPQLRTKNVRTREYQVDWSRWGGKANSAPSSGVAGCFFDALVGAVVASTS